MVALHIDVTPSQAKIALKAGSEDELLELEAIAKSLNLAARSIFDALVTASCALFMKLILHSSGRTQIAAGSRTVLGIGPGTYIEIDAELHLQVYNISL